MKKLLLILNTIKYLRPIQIYYQLWYRIRKMWRKTVGFRYPLSIEKKATPLTFIPWIDKTVSYKDGVYTFLNQQEINPSFDGNTRGALWVYNLNYMDYLLQTGMDKDSGLNLINHFIKELPRNPKGLDPYPIALRGINWIKFFSTYSIFNTQYSNSLYAQYQILLDNLEYHLLGNHLLEDGFSILFGAFYFNDKKFYKKAKETLETELEEQILDDGAHFELSPMYHQIIMDRMLDCINLLQNNQRFIDQNSLIELIQSKASKMLIWLNKITFTNGEIPLLNDSSPNIAPSTKQINDYAFRLGLVQSAKPELQIALSSSGYRKFTTLNYECLIDIGHVGPSYQPGHAHADTFNFVLNIKNNPIIVDTGISTYESNKRRISERGTAAHNSVTVDDNNSSKVWSSFRVAQRAKVEILKDKDDYVIAQHNGFQKSGIIHQRKWNLAKNKIEITELLIGKKGDGKAHFWLAPGLIPILSDNKIKIGETSICFSNKSIKIIKMKIPNGYNQFLETFKIESSFKGQLITTITTA